MLRQDGKTGASRCQVYQMLVRANDSRVTGANHEIRATKGSQRIHMPSYDKAEIEVVSQNLQKALAK